MATLLGALLVSMGLETGEFRSGLTIVEKDLKKTTRSIERMGRKIGDMGQKLTVGVTAPLVLLGKKSVEGFIDQEKAMADVNAALKSMGGASGKTGRELAKAADAMELRSLYDADVILKQVTANLLTFGNVAGEQFDRAQQASIDMAERLGTEPRSAAIMLGKALNDPVKGITALTRVGVQFTDQQRKQIDAMVKAGDTASAQGIILGEVEKQFKGAAAAAADASPWRKAQVNIGQAMDKIGEAILPLIGPVTDAIAGIASAFASLPEPIQKAAVVAGVMAAALGPIMMALGPIVGLMAPFLAQLKLIGAAQGGLIALQSGIVGIASAFGPMILAAGAAYLVWKNWDDIAPRLQPIVDELMAIGEGLGIVEGDASRTNAELAKNEGFRSFGEALKDTSGFLQKLADDFDAHNARIAASNAAGWRKLGDDFRAFDTQISGMVNAIPGKLAAVAGQMVKVGRDIIAGLVRGIKAAPGAVKDALFSVVNTGVQSVKSFLGIKSPSRLFMEIGENISAGLGLGIKAGASKAEIAMQELAGRMQSLMERLYPQMAKIRDMNAELDDIDASEKAGKISGELAEDMRFRTKQDARGVLGDKVEVKLDQGPLFSAKQIEDAVDRTAKSLGLLQDKAKIQTVRVAKSFKDMAQETIGALDNMIGAIKGGGFLDILSSVFGLATQLGSIGAFGKSIQANINKVPAYAGGTNFHPGGLAVVGERGPELVSMPQGSKVFTNSQSKGMMGGGSQVEIIPSPYFDVRVDGRIVNASPSIMEGGAQVASSRMSRKQSRRVG